MRIVCPACDAIYDVPDVMLGAGGRVVRCARCGTEWTPGATSVAPLPPDEPDLDFDAPPPPKPRSSEPAQEQAAAVEHEPDAAPDAQGRQEPRLRPLRPRAGPPREAAPPPEPAPPPRRAGIVAIVAWAASILVVVGGGVGAVLWRAQVMSAWPPSERLFAALGLH